MGVKLSDLVEKKRLTFDELKHKAVAIDFSQAAYQFLSSIRQQDGTPLTDAKGNVTSHLLGVLSRSANVMAQGIKMAYVLDGPPPQLKVQTLEQRYGKKRDAEERFEEAKEEGDEALMLKYSKQFVHLSRDMAKEAEELIQALGMPTIQAPAEADAQLAYCCKQGDVWAAATSDFDTLLHASPKMLINLTLSQTRKTSSGARVQVFPELIELDSMLKNLNISQEQLIALGMLVGTDYHPGVRGIGPKKALKIVTEFKTPKKIFAEHPLEGQDWQEVYDLFTKMKVQKKYSLEWSPPDIEKVLKILVDRHEFTEERIMGTIAKMTGSKKKLTADQKGLGSWM